MTPRRFKFTRFRKGILDYSLECITLLQNDFFKQLYITFNITIPGQDRIDPNTYLCRTFFTGYIRNPQSNLFFDMSDAVSGASLIFKKRFQGAFSN